MASITEITRQTIRIPGMILFLKQSLLKKRRCRRCNKDFVFDKLNSFGYFCSAECRKAHCNEKNLEDQRRHRARLEVKNCSVCGASFAPCYKKQVFCGRSCAARSKNKLAGVVFTCAGCGNSFKPKAKTNKYCSLACFNKARGVKILCDTEE